MKKYTRIILALFLTCLAMPASATNSPCYFAGSFVKCFPATGVLLDNQRVLRFGELTSNGANYLGFKAAASMTSDFTLTWPSDAGSSGQCLSTNGTDTLSWASRASVPATAGPVYSTGTALSSLAFASNGNKVFGIDSGGTTAELKSFAVGTSGSDFAVANGVGTITFNLPDAGTGARGAMTSSSQTLGGLKTFSSGINVPDNVFSIQDDGDATKQLRFQASGITTGTVRTLTAPNVSDTIAVLNTAQTFTNPQTFGTVKTGVCAKSADYTITDTDGCDTILVTTGASTRTMTLPDATNNTGRIITFKKVDSGVGKITVTRAGSDTIDGYTSTDAGVGSGNQYAYLILKGSSAVWSSLGANDYIASNVSSYGSTGATTVVADLTTITLFSGEWDVTGAVNFNANGGTFGSGFANFAEIISAAGDSTTGANDGINLINLTGSIPTNFTKFGIVIPVTRVTSDGTNVVINGASTASQTVRIKARIDFTGTTPQFAGFIRARKIR